MALWAVLDLLRRSDVPVIRYDRLARIGNFQDIVRSTTSFEIGNGECDAVQKEMDRLGIFGRPHSSAQRQVRQLRLAALIERREDAVRSLLRASIRHRPSKFVKQRRIGRDEEGQ